MLNSPRIHRILAGIAPLLTFVLCSCQFPGMKKTETVPPHNPCVVLALPASGNIAPIATKIKRGANIALEALKKEGISVVLQNIDTQAPDWLTKLEALPPYCAVVGGPMQDKTYLQAKQSKAVERRIFFSFVPNLSADDEGKIAWRFFPSPHDQVEALTNFGINDLNIHSYGALYPDDAYGKRMTQLMEESLAKRHITLSKNSYNPARPNSWSDAAAVLIKPGVAEDGKTPIPQTSFEAIFLPDSWKKMDLLTQSLMYNGEDRLILMGTSLWEQGLAGKSVSKANKYALTVFPGAWDMKRAPKALQEKGNDFWVALGYDFVNFAVNSGLDQRLDASQITAKARQAASAIRAMAPLNWSDTGVANQKLYIFQVGPAGIIPVDVERLRQARAAIAENAALRMQGLSPSEEGMPDTAQIVTPASASEPVQMTPQQPVQQPVPAVQQPIQQSVTQPMQPTTRPLSTTPQPSYKLRLPTPK